MTGYPSVKRPEEDELVSQVALGPADYGPLVARTFLSLIPVLGGALSTALEGLPERRDDRIARCLLYVERRVCSLEAKIDERAAAAARGEAPEWLHLFLSGVRASSEARSDERLRRIAALLAEGLTQDEVTAMRHSRLLQRLGMVDDQELLVLSEVEKASGVTVVSGHPVSDNVASEISAEDSEIKELPSSLALYDTNELLLMLQGLTSAGFVDGGVTTILANGVTVRGFRTTAIGRHILDATDNVH